MARDYWNRPYVSTDGNPLRYEKGRKTPVNAEAYTRISTLAGALDDKSGLIDWSCARAMIGTVKSESIFAQIAHLISAHKDPWNVPDAKKPLKELVRKASELGGADDASGLGTAFHGLTEVLDGGNRPDFIPRQLVDWLDVYQEVMADWEPVLIEPFVVVDELKVAGSPDRYLRHRKTGQVVCADIKSGTSEPEYPGKVSSQVAIGAHGVLYDQATGKRTEIDCDLVKGLLIHVPIREKKPRCDLYWLDLAKGWSMAQLAVKVREVKKMDKLEKVA